MTEITTPVPVPRVFASVRRHGFPGAVRRGWRRVVRPLVHRVALTERHVWYELGLPERAQPLTRGYELRRGSEAELRTSAMGVHPATGRAHLAGGAELWVAVQDGEVAFSTWLHRRTAPAIAARGGAFPLPAGVVCMEDTYAHPDHRGSGIAVTAVEALLARLRDEGVRTVVTKIAEDNTPARMAISKVDSREVGAMRLRRIGPRTKVTVEPRAAGDPVAALLAERLAR